MNIGHRIQRQGVRALAALSCLALLAGCNSVPKRDAEFAAVPPAQIPPVPQGNGAIFQAGFERSWFENVRARHIGDIVLVNLVEDTEAKHTNSGTVSKENDTSITNPTLFGKLLSFDIPGRSGSYNLDQSLASSTDFSGDADNTQNNEFSGSISVMVTEVLPNGYLRVRGEKRIGMTGGNEYIRVSGIIRPEDIDTRNTVDSTRVADATLIYIGDGQVASASKMGWLAKFFISAIMPF
ncbi:MAG: flagellar basal body L-ring protein FlgH [Chromatiaceae bacterium]|nr:flagellar basal body L-ring protein FlgH [Chromatiaceae bacterium]MCP5313767.1 flagellar basal body L-ring protein FlgH [Chromatiaceae bacterium]